jgi:Ni,Fe-hydrogenase I small subunit
MSTQADYTAEEWNLVTSGPVIAGTTIIVADPAFFGAIKESAAIAQAIVASGQTSQVELIQAIAAAGRGGQKYQTPDVPKDQGTEGAMKMLIAECRRAVKLVKEKSPDEAKDYAQYLVYIARVTAESSKEGGFLGIGATRVSEQESAAIDRLAEALGVSSEQA